jgi:hypothetical protein
MIREGDPQSSDRRSIVDPMASNGSQFVSRGRVEASIDEVSDILADVTALPRWWPSVYLEVDVVEQSDEERRRVASPPGPTFAWAVRRST